MTITERIKTLAAIECLMIDIEWGRRVYYMIDCSAGDWLLQIPVLTVLHLGTGEFENTLEISFDEIVAWLDVHKTLYLNVLARQPGDSAPATALREAAKIVIIRNGVIDETRMG